MQVSGGQEDTSCNFESEMVIYEFRSTLDKNKIKRLIEHSLCGAGNLIKLRILTGRRRPAGCFNTSVAGVEPGPTEKNFS